MIGAEEEKTHRFFYMRNWKQRKKEITIMSVRKIFCLLLFSASVCCLFGGCEKAKDCWNKLTSDDKRTWLTFDEKMSFIDDKAFAYKKNFYGVHITSNIRRIGKEAFRDGNFECVKIDEGLEVIGPEAFAGCDKLREVNIPKSVKTIGEGAFKGCPCEESVKSRFPAYR